MAILVEIIPKMDSVEMPALLFSGLSFTVSPSSHPDLADISNDGIF